MDQLEEWRPIPGWEGVYSISNIGRVRSEAREAMRRNGRRAQIKTRMLRAPIGHRGYRIVCLRRVGYHEVREIHRLVLLGFVGPLPDGLVTRHLDGDSLNNLLGNLRYGTFAENSQDMADHGRKWQLNRTHCSRGHRLAGANLLPSRARQGHRGCLSCNRAHGWVRRVPGRDLIAAANRYYTAILEEHPELET